jgi:putative transposase
MDQFKSNPMVSMLDLLSWSGVPRNSFYYKRGNGLHGRKPSMMNVTQDGELVKNTVVLKDVETILQQEFCCYGYKNVWDELKEKGYIFNHKKVYRLMKLHNLLFNPKVGSKGVPRKFVRFIKIKAESPLEHLCMDIKYIHTY